MAWLEQMLFAGLAPEGFQRLPLRTVVRHPAAMSQRSAVTGSVGRFKAALGDSPPLRWSFLYFFCLLSGYYVLRPVRDAMGASSEVEAVFPPGMIGFFAARGIPLKELILQVLSTCSFILILVAQPIYGALVSRFPRRVFLPVLFGFFILCLFGFHALFDSNVAGRGMAFFVWVTVFNVFSVAVFWSFMADVFSSAEAKKYYGYIGAAGTIGAFTGPLLTRVLAEKVGLANLMLVSAAFLAACLVCIWRLRRWALLREAKVGRDNESAMGGDVLAGLKLIAKEPLLRWLAAMVFLGVGVGALLYNQQAEIARTAFSIRAGEISMPFTVAATPAPGFEQPASANRPATIAASTQRTLFIRPPDSPSDPNGSVGRSRTGGVVEARSADAKGLAELDRR